MANASRLVFLALAVAAAGVHGYEVTSFEAKPEHPTPGSTVTLMAKGSDKWETCKFFAPSSHNETEGAKPYCKFRNEDGGSNWKLAEGFEKAKCIFDGNAGNHQCGLMVTADACAAGKWTVKMEPYEMGFYEGKNGDVPETLELKIDGAKSAGCDPTNEKPGSNPGTNPGTNPGNNTDPTASPNNGDNSGGPSSARTSMGLVAAVTLMALSYNY